MSKDAIILALRDLAEYHTLIADEFRDTAAHAVGDPRKDMERSEARHRDFTVAMQEAIELLTP